MLISRLTMLFDEVLRTFAGFFEREGIRYAVVGGLAVHAWGGSRLTRDVDFLVERSHQPTVIRFAESLGYETVHVSDAFSNHAHGRPELGRVDVLYVGQETAEKIFAAVSPKPVVSDFVVPVASPEHLAMMKALAMKNFPHRALFESEDVRLLLDLPGVDETAVREYFERQGLLELYDAIKKTRRTS